MAKRFIETELFKDPFVRGLQAPLKLLWVYLFTACDHSGFWDVEIDVACLRLGIEVTKEEAEKAFAEKIKLFDNGQVWFIPSYIKLQHKNELKSTNKAQNNAIQKLLKYDLLQLKAEGIYELKNTTHKPLQSPLQGATGNGNGIRKKEMEKEKESTARSSFHAPTLNEVKQQAELLMITPDIAEIYFNSRMSTGWQRNGNEIKNWLYDLKSFADSYKANHVGKTKAPNGTTMPNYYDARYERTLQGPQIIEYHKHLKALGWVSTYSGTGGTSWAAPKDNPIPTRHPELDSGSHKRNGTTQPLNELITVDK